MSRLALLVQHATDYVGQEQVQEPPLAATQTRSRINKRARWLSTRCNHSFGPCRRNGQPLCFTTEARRHGEKRGLVRLGGLARFLFRCRFLGKPDPFFWVAFELGPATAAAHVIRLAVVSDLRSGGCPGDEALGSLLFFARGAKPHVSPRGADGRDLAYQSSPS